MNGQGNFVGVVDRLLSGNRIFKEKNMEENKIELIAKAIRKECSSYSLVEWCESWEIYC